MNGSILPGAAPQVTPERSKFLARCGPLQTGGFAQDNDLISSRGRMAAPIDVVTVRRTGLGG